MISTNDPLHKCLFFIVLLLCMYTVMYMCMCPPRLVGKPYCSMFCGSQLSQCLLWYVLAFFSHNVNIQEEKDIPHITLFKKKKKSLLFMGLFLSSLQLHVVFLRGIFNCQSSCSFSKPGSIDLWSLRDLRCHHQHYQVIPLNFFSELGVSKHCKKRGQSWCVHIDKICFFFPLDVNLNFARAVCSCAAQIK